MRKSKHQIIIVYMMSLLIASCQNPVMIKPVPQNIAIPDIPEIIEEQKTMMMNPIEEYEKYVVNDSGHVFGLKESSKDAIVFQDTEDNIHKPDTFFVKDDIIFFSVKVMEDGPEEIPESDPTAYVKIPKIYYFMQSNKTIEEWTGSFDIPESKYIEMGITPWSIISGNYKESQISSIAQFISNDNKPVKNFLKIDGYHVGNFCIWFSVPEGIKGAEKGLWYSALNSGRFQRVGDYGRIW